MSKDVCIHIHTLLGNVRRMTFSWNGLNLMKSDIGFSKVVQCRGHANKNMRHFWHANKSLAFFV